MELIDEMTLDEYDALPPTTQIFYKKSDESANLDLGLNNILNRGGYTSAQNKLRGQLNELTTTINQFKEFADTPEALAQKIRNWEALEATNTGGEDLKKITEELKAASAKQLAEELSKQGASFKQKISELEESNKSYQEKFQGIKLWEEISSLAPDLKPKYHEIFKRAYLQLFTLDENGNIKLSATDPESLITTPAKKMDSLRKEFPELFLGAKEIEFSPYNKTTPPMQTDSAKKDYYEAVKNRDINAMLAAQRRMQ